jgi:hypothetical protein
MYGVKFSDVSYPTGTTWTWHRFAMPAGISIDNVVSVVPYGGVNDIVYMGGVALGWWSGVQLPTEISVLMSLGNGVASPWATIRIYYRSA